MSKETPRNLIWKHIKAIETCMMVTHDGDQIRARPMRGIPRPEQNAIWFYIDTEAPVEAELQRDHHACLTYADLKSNAFVSVSGVMRHVRDRDTIIDLWNPAAEGYFPKGPNDPRIGLLRFEPETGQYWDAPSSAIVVAIKFLEAKIMGERANLGTTGTAKFE